MDHREGRWKYFINPKIHKSSSPFSADRSTAVVLFLVTMLKFPNGRRNGARIHFVDFHAASDVRQQRDGKFAAEMFAEFFEA